MGEQGVGLRGLRARVTLTRSLATATGWVVDLTDLNAVIDARLGQPPDPSEWCVVEVSTSEGALLAAGQISGDVSGSYVIDIHSTLLVSGDTPARKRVSDVSFELEDGPRVLVGKVHDVSVSGLGLECRDKLVTQKYYPLRLSTPIGEVCGTFEVRYSRPDATRTGGIFVVTDRVDRARWRTYVQRRLGT